MRLQGGSSTASPVICGVPQGTVLGPLFFLILMSDIDIGVLNAKVVSFADDTRLYSKKQLNLHLSPILDFPCTPNFNNSLDNAY